MKILHVSDHYPPALGGIEMHVSQLAARQAARSHDVTVLTSTSRDVDGEHDDDTGPVTVRRVRPGTREARQVDFGAYDVCHVHVSVLAPFSAPVAARAVRSGVPTVVTVHSLWQGLGPVPGLAALAVGLRDAPVLWTAVSQVAADRLARQLPARARVLVLPNAADVPARPPVPDQDGEVPVRLVSTMRIARRKRPLALVRMVDRLRGATHRPVELTIVGDGPLRPRLEQRVRRRGLTDAVTVTGRLPVSGVLEQVARADLYVAPAVLESFGIAALEARALGLPVVGRSGTGVGEFVRDGIDGWLCESDAAMVDRLRTLVEDDALRRKISEHNRTVPPGLTWPQALDRHDRVYALAEATSRRRAGSRALAMLEP